MVSLREKGLVFTREEGADTEQMVSEAAAIKENLQLLLDEDVEVISYPSDNSEPEMKSGVFNTSEAMQTTLNQLILPWLSALNRAGGDMIVQALTEVEVTVVGTKVRIHCAVLEFDEMSQEHKSQDNAETTRDDLVFGINRQIGIAGNHYITS